MRSLYLNYSRRADTGGEINSPFIKPMVSPSLLMWMRGSRGWYAFEVFDAPIVRMSEMRRWKIAALIVAIFFSGIATAGTLQTRLEFGSAIGSKTTHNSDDRTRRQITAVISDLLPTRSEPGAAIENEITHEFYNRFYDRKRRQITGMLLSVGDTSGTGVEVKNNDESYDRNRRQITAVSLSTGGASGAAIENEITHEFYNRFYDRKRRQITGVLLTVRDTSGAGVEVRNNDESYDRNRRQITAVSLSTGDASGAAIEIRKTHKSYDRKRRQITGLSSDFRRSAHAAPRAWLALPPHRLFVPESRGSISSSHVDNKQNLNPYSSRTVPEISISSLDELQTVDQPEVNTSESESAEKQANISASAIPKPIRKPRKPRKSVKATPAKMLPKKASGRCWNRIWRC